jgi:hypothetical protein
MGAKTFEPRYSIKVPARQQSSKAQCGHLFGRGSQFQNNALSRLRSWEVRRRRWRSERVDGHESVTLRHPADGRHMGGVPCWRGGGAGKAGPGQESGPTFRLGLLGARPSALPKATRRRNPTTRKSQGPSRTKPRAPKGNLIASRSPRNQSPLKYWPRSQDRSVRSQPRLRPAKQSLPRAPTRRSQISDWTPLTPLQSSSSFCL